MISSLIRPTHLALGRTLTGALALLLLTTGCQVILLDPEPEGLLELTGDSEKVWHLAGRLENSQDVYPYLPVCEADDILIFRHSYTYDLANDQVYCAPNEPYFLGGGTYELTPYYLYLYPQDGPAQSWQLDYLTPYEFAVWYRVGSVQYYDVYRLG